MIELVYRNTTTSSSTLSKHELDAENLNIAGNSSVSNFRDFKQNTNPFSAFRRIIRFRFPLSLYISPVSRQPNRVYKANNHTERERKWTVFVRDLDVKEDKLEATGIGANDLLENPLECSSAAYRRVWISFDRRLVHSNHYPSSLALHLLLVPPTQWVTHSVQLAILRFPKSLVEKLHRLRSFWKGRGAPLCALRAHWASRFKLLPSKYLIAKMYLALFICHPATFFKWGVLVCQRKWRGVCHFLSDCEPWNNFNYYKNVVVSHHSYYENI